MENVSENHVRVSGRLFPRESCTSEWQVVPAKSSFTSSRHNFGISDAEMKELLKRPYPRFRPSLPHRLIAQTKTIWPFIFGWAVTLFLLNKIPITDEDRAQSYFQYQKDVREGKIKPEDHPSFGKGHH